MESFNRTAPGLYSLKIPLMTRIMKTTRIIICGSFILPVTFLKRASNGYLIPFIAFSQM